MQCACAANSTQRWSFSPALSLLSSRRLLRSTSLDITANGLDTSGPAAGRPSRKDGLTDPEMPYPASKVGAENVLKESGLNRSIQRFGFVYGDGGRAYCDAA